MTNNKKISVVRCLFYYDHCFNQVLRLMWSCTSAPSYVSTAWCLSVGCIFQMYLVKHRGNFAFTALQQLMFPFHCVSVCQMLAALRRVFPPCGLMFIGHPDVELGCRCHVQAQNTFSLFWG